MLRLKCRLGTDVRVLSVPSNTSFYRIKAKLQSKFGVPAFRYLSVAGLARAAPAGLPACSSRTVSFPPTHPHNHPPRRRAPSRSARACVWGGSLRWRDDDGDEVLVGTKADWSLVLSDVEAKAERTGDFDGDLLVRLTATLDPEDPLLGFQAPVIGGRNFARPRTGVGGSSGGGSGAPTRHGGGFVGTLAGGPPRSRPRTLEEDTLFASLRVDAGASVPTDGGVGRVLDPARPHRVRVLKSKHAQRRREEGGGGGGAGTRDDPDLAVNGEGL